MGLPDGDSGERGAAAHLTQELAARLRSAVVAGTYGPGQLIPSERDLAIREAVSRTTVRRAIQLLVGEGVLHRVPGSGTYVGRQPPAESAQGHATIGMILPGLANPYFGELATAVEREASRRGYQLLLGQADLTGRSAAPYLERYAESRSVLGVIAVSESKASASAYQQFALSGKPLAFVVRHADVISADSVATDHVGGAHELTRHLIALGHRRIAYIGQANMPVMRHYQGYLEGLHEAGIAPDPALQVGVDCEGLEQVGVEGVRDLLGRGISFTAIFAQIDLVAVGVLRALRAAGLAVPRDVSVVGFDNIPSAAHLYPPLTSVDHSVGEIGRLAVMMLEDRISGRYDGPTRRVIIQPRLVLRESTGPPGDYHPGPPTR
jgi:LacI family transcriptional regulator